MRVKLIKKLWLTFCQLVCDAWTGYSSLEYWYWGNLCCGWDSLPRCFYEVLSTKMLGCENWVIGGMIYSDREET